MALPHSDSLPSGIEPSRTLWIVCLSCASNVRIFYMTAPILFLGILQSSSPGRSSYSICVEVQYQINTPSLSNGENRSSVQFRGKSHLSLSKIGKNMFIATICGKSDLPLNTIKCKYGAYNRISVTLEPKSKKGKAFLESTAYVGLPKSPNRKRSA